MAGLEALGDDLFLVDGPVVRDMGIHFDTRMTVARLGDGSVWIASPVPVPFATLTEITDLGPVRYLVSPTPGTSGDSTLGTSSSLRPSCDRARSHRSR